MQPNNQYEPIPTGIDYLNQIAPPPPPAKASKKSLIVIALLVIVGLSSVAVIGNMISKGNNNGPSVLKLVAKLQKLEKITKKYSPKIKSLAVQDANGSLSSILATATNQQSMKTLSSSSVDISKQKKQIEALDSSAKLEAKLDDAYLNSFLDETYAREISFELEEAAVMMKRLLKSASTTSMKEYLTTTTESFESLQKRFSKIVVN